MRSNSNSSKVSQGGKKTQNATSVLTVDNKTIADDAVVDLEPLPPMDFYRSSAVGHSLTMALNELLSKNEIPPQEAFLIRGTFDNVFEPMLRDNLVIKKDLIYHDGEGKLANYSNIEDLWRIDTDDFKVKIGDDIRPYKRARILFAKENQPGK